MKTISPKDTILFACRIGPDGIGNLGHFIDIVKGLQKTNLLNHYQPLYLIVDCKGGVRLNQMRAVLKENGFDPEKENIQLVGERYDEINSLERYIETHSNFREALLKVKGMINISVQDLDPYLSSEESAVTLRNFFDSRDIKIPCTSIFKHSMGRKAKTDEPHLCYSMGLRFAYREGGVLIKSIDAKDFPADKLLSIQDKNFLTALLVSKNGGKNTSKSTIDNIGTAKQFLKTSLLIPGYFQEGSEQFLTLLNAISSSELAAPYDEIVFVINKDNIVANKQIHAERLSECIDTITFQSKSGDDSCSETTFINRNKKVDRAELKRVRIIEGYWLNEADHDILHQCAQIFGGCSGDKSTEKAISYFLVPLLQFREWKSSFANGFIDHTKYVLRQHNIPDKDNLVARYLELLLDIKHTIKSKSALTAANELSMLLTHEFMEQWRIVLGDLHQNHNFYNELPKIAEQMLNLINTVSGCVEMCAKK